MIDEMLQGLIWLVALLGAGVIVFGVVDRVRNGD